MIHRWKKGCLDHKRAFRRTSPNRRDRHCTKYWFRATAIFPVHPQFSASPDNCSTTRWKNTASRERPFWLGEYLVFHLIDTPYISLFRLPFSCRTANYFSLFSLPRWNLFFSANYLSPTSPSPWFCEISTNPIISITCWIWLLHILSMARRLLIEWPVRIKPVGDKLKNSTRFLRRGICRKATQTRGRLTPSFSGFRPRSQFFSFSGQSCSRKIWNKTWLF